MERFLLFRGKKCSFRGIPRLMEESIPKLRMEQNYMEKINFTTNPASANRIESFYSSALLLFLFHGAEFHVVFSSAKWFGKEFQVFVSISVPRKGMLSCFLFRGKVQNGILRVCFYFCAKVHNSEHFSPLRNSLEWSSENFPFRGSVGIPP